MSPDWAASSMVVPYATYTDPQSLNLYNYMRNNPLAGTDPDGHCPFFLQTACNTFHAVEGAITSYFNQPQPTVSHTFSLTAGAGITGPPFANQLPNLFPQELSTMNGLGVTPLSPGDPGFAASAEQAAGQINWTLGANGELLTTPALDGVTHAATAGGADVLGAGTAQVATGGGQTLVFDITAQSGHYMNGATVAQSEGAIDAGAAAFGAFIDGVLRDIIPPMILPQAREPRQDGPI